MVQPKYNPKEALERVKLLMNYDSKKTLTENRIGLSEAPPDYSSAIEIKAPGVGMAEIAPPQGAKRGYKYYEKNGQVYILKPTSATQSGKTRKREIATVELDTSTPDTRVKGNIIKRATQACSSRGSKWYKFWLGSGGKVGIAACIAAATTAMYIFGVEVMEYPTLITRDPSKTASRYIAACRNEKKLMIHPETAIEKPFEADVNWAKSQKTTDKLDAAFAPIKGGAGTELATLGISGDFGFKIPFTGIEWEGLGTPQTGVFSPAQANTIEKFCGVILAWEESHKSNTFDDKLFSELNNTELEKFNKYVFGLYEEFFKEDSQKTSPTGCPSGASEKKEADIPSWAKNALCINKLINGVLKEGKFPCFGTLNGEEYLSATDTKRGRVYYMASGKVYSENNKKIFAEWTCAQDTVNYVLLESTHMNKESNKLLFLELNEQGGEPVVSIPDNEKKKQTGETKPKKDEFCPNGYKQCTGEYGKCCIADKIKQMQKCLGIAPPHEGRWGPRTDAAYKAAESSWGGFGDALDDSEIDTICFCPEGYNDCSGSYKKCCRSPKIAELKACLKFTTTDTETWGPKTDNELKKLRPELANGFTDDDIKRICQPGRAIKIIDPRDF